MPTAFQNLAAAYVSISQTEASFIDGILKNYQAAIASGAISVPRSAVPQSEIVFTTSEDWFERNTGNQIDPNLIFGFQSRNISGQFTIYFNPTHLDDLDSGMKVIHELMHITHPNMAPRKGGNASQTEELHLTEFYVAEAEIAGKLRLNEYPGEGVSILLQTTPQPNNRIIASIERYGITQEQLVRLERAFHSLYGRPDIDVAERLGIHLGESVATHFRDSSQCFPNSAQVMLFDEIVKPIDQIRLSDHMQAAARTRIFSLKVFDLSWCRSAVGAWVTDHCLEG